MYEKKFGNDLFYIIFILQMSFLFLSSNKRKAILWIT
jgi:hypothetical protein